ncbi:hypothetical protein [Paenibacillus piscarius]|uniref:hypothetical protein n=1 Tax=Paenibacillus piscarius TaxID=1089681 RepID=UPI001EE94E49|nr:hypothetical protein [Paenibacillus piscarius]
MTKPLPDQPMSVKEVQAALAAGERFFKGYGLGDTVVIQEVLRWGKAFVRFTTPNMKYFISTNIRTFAWGVFGVYKEGECLCGGGGADGVLPGCDSGGQSGHKETTKGLSQNDKENQSLREEGVSYESRVEGI